MSNKVDVIYAVETDIGNGKVSQHGHFYTRKYDAERRAKQPAGRGQGRVVAYKLTELVLN